ncbi:MAG: lipopolysaccharide biosynthesis protein [Herminiimonas sp.]|nr:lipopolysaccharide biosynthesis protein [Herminiimonas sp.]
MAQLRRSIFITFFSSNAMTAVQFGVTLVLARLLTPAEVGIFSITSVVIGIASVFRDFGVSSYLQSERVLTPEKIRAALGLLITTSWFLAAALFFSSDFIGRYYEQPAIASVMRVLTISFVMIPFASFFHALLTRDMEAGKQAIVNAAGTFSYATTCIFLAYRGYGTMSLAWANVANVFTTIVIYFIFRPPGIALIPSLRGWRHPVNFGAGAILSNLLNHTYASIPDLVLGKLSGPHSVGLYSRANGLVGIFQQIAGPTMNYNALPYIAANHHAKTPLGPILYKATSYLTGFALPALVGTAVFAKEIILVLYGEAWTEAAPLVSILCASYGLRIGYSLCQPAMTAIGRPYLSAISSGSAIIARIALISLMGAPDVMTFAIALLIADILSAPVPALLMSRYLMFTVRQSMGAHLSSILVAIVCGAACILLQFVLPPTWPHILRLLIVGLVGSATWIASVLIFKHPLRVELVAMIKKIVPRKSVANIKS